MSLHENSAAAFAEHKSSGRSEVYREAVFNLLVATGRPMTDREIFETLQEPDVNNVRPEITRLKQAGRIVEVGKVTCPKTGKKVRLTRPAQ